jgi:hypothetical protein
MSDEPTELTGLQVRPRHRFHTLLSLIAGTERASHASLGWNDRWEVTITSAQNGRSTKTTVADHPTGQHRTREMTFEAGHADLGDPILLLGELLDDEAEQMLWGLRPPDVFTTLVYADVAALPETAQVGPDYRWWMRVRLDTTTPRPSLMMWPLVDRNKDR